MLANTVSHAAAQSSAMLRRNNTSGLNWGLLMALCANAAFWMLAFALMK